MASWITIKHTQFKTTVQIPYLLETRYPISDQTGWKTPPFRAVHTYIAHKRECPEEDGGVNVCVFVFQEVDAFHYAICFFTLPKLLVKHAVICAANESAGRCSNAVKWYKLVPSPLKICPVPFGGKLSPVLVNGKPRKSPLLLSFQYERSLHVTWLH